MSKHPSPALGSCSGLTVHKFYGVITLCGDLREDVRTQRTHPSYTCVHPKRQQLLDCIDDESREVDQAAEKPFCPFAQRLICGEKQVAALLNAKPHSTFSERSIASQRSGAPLRRGLESSTSRDGRYGIGINKHSRPRFPVQTLVPVYCYLFHRSE